MTVNKDALWKRRWILTNALSVGGFITLAIGLLIWRKGLFGYQDDLVGKLVFLVGLIEMLLLPLLFRKLWRREDNREK